MLLKKYSTYNCTIAIVIVVVVVVLKRDNYGSKYFNEFLQLGKQ